MQRQRKMNDLSLCPALVAIATLALKLYNPLHGPSYRISEEDNKHPTQQHQKANTGLINKLQLAVKGSTKKQES